MVYSSCGESCQCIDKAPYQVLIIPVTILYSELHPKVGNLLHELSVQHPEHVQVASASLSPQKLEILSKMILYVTAKGSLAQATHALQAQQDLQ